MSQHRPNWDLPVSTVRELASWQDAVRNEAVDVLAGDPQQLRRFGRADLRFLAHQCDRLAIAKGTRPRYEQLHQRRRKRELISHLGEFNGYFLAESIADLIERHARLAFAGPHAMQSFCSTRISGIEANIDLGDAWRDRIGLRALPAQGPRGPAPLDESLVDELFS